MQTWLDDLLPTGEEEDFGPAETSYDHKLWFHSFFFFCRKICLLGLLLCQFCFQTEFMLLCHSVGELICSSRTQCAQLLSCGNHAVSFWLEYQYLLSYSHVAQRNKTESSWGIYFMYLKRNMTDVNFKRDFVVNDFLTFHAKGLSVHKFMH